MGLISQSGYTTNTKTGETRPLTNEELAQLSATLPSLTSSGSFGSGSGFKQFSNGLMSMASPLAMSPVGGNAYSSIGGNVLGGSDSSLNKLNSINGFTTNLENNLNSSLYDLWTFNRDRDD